MSCLGHVSISILTLIIEDPLRWSKETFDRLPYPQGNDVSHMSARTLPNENLRALVDGSCTFKNHAQNLTRLEFYSTLKCFGLLLPL
jgi:hypothetical protein